MIEKHKRLSYIIAFTGLFILTALIVFWPIIINEKLFIYTHDGYYQHFNSLAYYGRYLRELFTQLFVNHSFKLQMFDLRLGLGADVITTLHYYCIGDPLYLLTIFVPEGKMELFHTFLIVFRMYLAGLTFSALAIKLKNRRIYTLFGALIYAFSGYMLIPGVMHIMFQPAAIYLPLVLLGIEKLLNKEKPYIFIWAVAAAAASNFYFFYMIALFAVIYFVFRYVQTQGGNASADDVQTQGGKALFNAMQTGNESEKKAALIQGLLLKGLQLAGFAVIGLLISSVIMLPVIMAMLSSKRMGVSHYVPLFYEWKYYLTNFAGFMTTQWLKEGTFYTYFGYSAMAVFSVAVIFAKRTKDIAQNERRAVKTLRYAFIMMVIFAAVPFCGYVLTAFSYVNNRWSFAFAALAAYMVVKALGYINSLSVWEIKCIGVILLIYSLLCFIPETIRENVTITQLVVLMALMAVLSLSCAGIYFTKNNILLFLTLTIFSVGMNGIYAGDNVGGLLKRGEAIARLLGNPVKAIGAMADDEVSRFEMEDIYEAQNMAWHEDKYGTGFYFSVLNGNVSKFLTDYELSNTTEYSFTNMDARSILDLALGVKYAVARSGEENKLPLLYDKSEAVVNVGDDYCIHTADTVLPIGYTYDKLIPLASYEEMDAVTKQEVLLQGACIMDESDDVKLEVTEPEVRHTEGAYEITETDGVSVNGNSFTAAEGGSVTITCRYPKAEALAGEDTAADVLSGRESAENYLEFINYRYTDVNRAAQADMSGKTIADKLANMRDARNYIPEDKGFFYIEAPNGKLSYSVNNERQPAYSGKHNYLYNIGSEAEEFSVKLVFKTPGIYSFDDMKLYSQPMDEIKELAAKRAKEALVDVKVETNEITGSIECEDDRLLCLAVPFSEGISIFVDGAKAKIYKVNTMFTGVYLDKGKHELRMVYETPYLKFGIYMTVLGLVCLLGYVIFDKRKNGKLQKENV